MIKIKRLPVDPVLKEKTEAISAEIDTYLKNRAAAKAAALAADPAARPPPHVKAKKQKDEELAKLVDKYSNSALGIKDFLKTESHGKCAYCESYVTHIAFGDIEHIVPKSLKPDLAVDLANLALACSICNNNKSDYFDAKAPLLDPHDDDPRAELIFAGWSIAEGFCKARGKNTLRELDLNRQDLNQRREKHFNALGELYSSWKKEKDEIEKYALLRIVWERTRPAAEYSSMCLTLVEWCKVETDPDS